MHSTDKMRFKAARGRLQYTTMRRLLAITLLVAATLGDAASAFAQPGPPGGDGMPWQLGAIFTGYWVVVAIAIAMLSKPSRRADKPKKPEGE